MGETRDNDAYEEELLDYEEEEEKVLDSSAAKTNGEAGKKGYVGIHSSGFRDFLLKPELLRSIVDSGFEHPSEGKCLTTVFVFALSYLNNVSEVLILIQHECIPQAILGMDVICQAKSGMGKTAVFVLSTLQQIDPIAGQVAALVLCHTRELAYQICHEFERFSTYLPGIKVAVFYGGVNIKTHKDLLKNECPHIVVGTPGRILALARDKDLSLKEVRHFILDECDKMLESLDMRRDVQEIFKMTPHDKQVMMFSATLSKAVRPVCKKFMQDPMEIYVDDEAKLTLHGLVQHYIKLSELEKNRKLNDLLDALDFNQVVIFVKSVSRAAALNKLLVDSNFPSICIHSGMSQEERLSRYKGFKDGKQRILVATDLVGRGIDIERVNIVINYDMPDSADTYLHRVGRAGRFGTKGLAVTFVASSSDSTVLNQCPHNLLLGFRLCDVGAARSSLADIWLQLYNYVVIYESWLVEGNIGVVESAKAISLPTAAALISEQPEVGSEEFSIILFGSCLVLLSFFSHSVIAAGNTFNVINFGATGNGITDDSKALRFHNCNGLQLKGTTHVDSPMNHIEVEASQNVEMSQLNIIAPFDSPNTDGIDIASSSHVNIHQSIIGTGDDCIAIKGESYFVNITGIHCGPGHGISVGSLGEGGATDVVENVFVRDCTLNGTTNGARIKTWQVRGVVQVTDVTFRGFQGTSATGEAISLQCSGNLPCTNLKLDNINIRSTTGVNIVSKCQFAHGIIVPPVVPNVTCLLK
ncbi:hypothetical protein KSS87_005266 [Heliosperma pusillum]|nr:hypothetical protein KSS87_005266 [Heliosperma pusillum]